MSTRPCSKPGCGKSAAGTLSYSYAEQTAVLGPLSLTVEPHCYDLCQRHMENLTVPENWTMLFHRDYRERFASGPERATPFFSDRDLL